MWTGCSPRGTTEMLLDLVDVGGSHPSVVFAIPSMEVAELAQEKDRDFPLDGYAKRTFVGLAVAHADQLLGSLLRWMNDPTYGEPTFLAITTGLLILYFCQFYFNLTCDRQPLHCHILADLFPDFPWKYHKAWGSV